MSMTEYAKTSDNFLAHRHFRKNIYAGILRKKENVVNVLEIYIDLFDHFAVSKKFVSEMLQTYVDAGRLEYDNDEMTEVGITDKGLADIEAMENRMRGQA